MWFSIVMLVYQRVSGKSYWVSYCLSSVKRPWLPQLYNSYGWWFGTFFFPYIGNNNPNWRTHIFWRGRYTTNQVKLPESKTHYYVMIFPVYPHHTLKMFLKVFFVLSIAWYPTGVAISSSQSCLIGRVPFI